MPSFSAERDLADAARTDALTGLGNRLRLREQFSSFAI